MKTILLILLTSFSFVGCTNHPKEKITEKVGTMKKIDIFGDIIHRLPIDSPITSDKYEIAKWLIDNYFQGKQIDINLIKASEGIEIFKIEIKGEIATSIPRHYTLINAHRKNSYLLPIEFNKLININREIMFGGIYNYREYDFYFIYSIVGKDLKLTFDSRKVNKEGIKIGYYADNSCIEYKPNRLMFNYDDKTSIFFYGVIKKFCKDGQDRTSEKNQPITEDKVSIRLDYDGKSWVYNTNSNYKFW